MTCSAVRTIFCAFDVYEETTRRYPTRKVLPESRVNNGTFCYLAGKDGRVRWFHYSDGSIWTTGNTFPVMRKIWPRKNKAPDSMATTRGDTSRKQET